MEKLKGAVDAVCLRVGAHDSGHHSLVVQFEVSLLVAVILNVYVRGVHFEIGV